MKYTLQLIFLLAPFLIHAQLGPYGINPLARKHAPHVEPIFQRTPQTKTTSVVDSAQWEVRYRYRMLGDRLKPMIEDETILLIGQEYTSYYSYRNELANALVEADPQKYRRRSTKMVLQDSLSRLPEGTICPPYNIFNRERFLTHRSSGEIFCVDSDIYRGHKTEGTYYYCYNEMPEKPLWVVSSDVDTLLHFSCQKATTLLGGRKWTVWFAPEIPLGEGPWKLRALPGLVLKADSDDGEFSLEALSIQAETKSPIEKFEASSCEKITKVELFRHKKTIAEDPFPFSFFGVKGSEKKKKYTSKYNPIEILDK